MEMEKENQIDISKLIKEIKKEQNIIKKCHDIIRPSIRKIKNKQYSTKTLEYNIRKIILIIEQWKNENQNKTKQYLKLLNKNINKYFWKFQLEEVKDFQNEFKDLCKTQKKFLRFLLK